MSDENNCVNCIHWRWSSGHPDYSDMTPGTGWSSDCRKQHWSMDGWDVSEQTFRENMRTARRCADYEERLSELPNIADFGFNKQILVRRGKAWALMALGDATEEAFRDVDEWKRVGP